MPCPHHDIKIVQRSNRQSAVAAAAYQSGERLFSEYDQKQKYYSEKRGIVHTEIMLPPHAPPEYADCRATLSGRLKLHFIIVNFSRKKAQPHLNDTVMPLSLHSLSSMPGY